MKVVKCPAGHGYDTERYESCPICKKSASSEKKTKVVRVRAVKKVQPEIKTEPVNESAETMQSAETEPLKVPETEEIDFSKVRFHEPVMMPAIKREIRNLAVKEPPVELPGKPTKIQELEPDRKNLTPEKPLQKPDEPSVAIEELCFDKDIESDINAVIDSANNMATDKSGKLLIKYFGKNEIIHIPAEITTVGKYAFSGNQYVKKIIMPNSIKSIDKFAFSFCVNLEMVVFSGSLENIGENAFYKCSALKELNFPNSLKNIGKGAFGKCSSLTILNFPTQLKKISDFSFCECTGLSRINISKSVETVGMSAFSKCHRLMCISMPESVTAIGENAFSWCSMLEDMDIPSSVKTIGSWAFYGCGKLKNLRISVHTKDVRDDAFCGCDCIDEVCIAELEGSNFNVSYVKKAHRLTLRILKQISQRKAERYASEHKLSKIFI